MKLQWDPQPFLASWVRNRFDVHSRLHSLPILLSVNVPHSGMLLARFGMPSINWQITVTHSPALVYYKK